MIGLAFDALTSFSIMPLRLASYLGLVLGVLSLLMLGYTLGSWALGHVVEGWTSLLTVVLILGSTQLILFGLLGEYVGRFIWKPSGGRCSSSIRCSAQQVQRASARHPATSVVLFSAHSRVSGNPGHGRACSDRAWPKHMIA